MITRAVGLVTLMLGSVACVPPAPGQVRSTENNAVVTISAGAPWLGYESTDLWYAIDRQTQTCWFMTSKAIASLDCCALRRATTARQYITWATCPDEPSATAPATP